MDNNQVFPLMIKFIYKWTTYLSVLAPVSACVIWKAMEPLLYTSCIHSRHTMFFDKDKENDVKTHIIMHALKQCCFLKDEQGKLKCSYDFCPHLTANQA